MKSKIERPSLGTRVIIKAWMQHKRDHTIVFKSAHWTPIRGGKSWQRQELEHPIEGVYIGWRTKFDGATRWEDDETGVVFYPTAHRELWMVVYESRRDPAFVLPEDCQLIPQETKKNTVYIEAENVKLMEFVVGVDQAISEHSQPFTVHFQPCPKCGSTMRVEIEEKESATAGTLTFKYLVCPTHGRVYLIS